MFASIALNIPKFLEAKLDTFSFMQNNVTSLRLNKDYMYYYIHWTR